MSLCPCGNTSEDSNPLCARCAALQVLDLPFDASQAQIKQAYHLLVKVWHPDRFQTDAKLKSAAEEKLKAINAAYISLTSGEPQPRRARPRPQAPLEPTYTAPSSAPSATPQPRRFRFGALGRFAATLATFGAIQRLLVLACGLGMSALLLHYIDTELAADPSTAGVYAGLKSGMVRQLAEPRQRAWDSIESAFHRLHPPSTASAAPIAPPDATPVPAPGARPQPASIHATRKTAVVQLQSYITTGLTRDEVLSIAGPPQSSSEDQIIFKGAEIDFKNGQVSGWKIDSSVSSLHVKLWPSPQTDRTLRIFSVDSTKDDVLVVQGTPSILADDKFAYGKSEIYFRNNRVVSWKDDPGSAPLHAIQR